ncbi:MAG: hypothetical protein ACRDQW_18495, partial [Haloechinothrix sp.]
KPIKNKNDIKPSSKLAAGKDDPINVVFFLQADDVLDHLMEHHFLGTHKEPRLWINGSINKGTGEVIMTSIGCHTINQ